MVLNVCWIELNYQVLDIQLSIIFNNSEVIQNKHA